MVSTEVLQVDSTQGPCAAAGMGRYKPVRQALDLLLHEDAQEVMLQKSPATGFSHSLAGEAG